MSSAEAGLILVCGRFIIRQTARNYDEFFKNERISLHSLPRRAGGCYAERCEANMIADMLEFNFGKTHKNGIP